MKTFRLFIENASQFISNDGTYKPDTESVINLSKNGDIYLIPYKFL